MNTTRPGPAHTVTTRGANPAEHAVLARAVHKRYREHHALDGLDLTVRGGTVHALLGPNGAGKTTAVNVFTTLARFDSGRVHVHGLDVATQAPLVRRTIGLTGQYAAVDETLTGRENLDLFARLHGLDPPTAGRRADELLDRFRLREAAHLRAGTYSGGMRRRLDIAAGLTQQPTVLFLDEPTTGLDPRSRNDVWDLVRELVQGGTTVLLTTQYLEEADQLADRVTVVDRGRAIAEGTPEELKTWFGGDRVEATFPDPGPATAAAALLSRLGGQLLDGADGTRVSVPAADRVAALTETVRVLDGAGLPPSDVTVRRPSLDEAFLALTSDKELPV